MDYEAIYKKEIGLLPYKYDDNGIIKGFAPAYVLWLESRLNKLTDFAIDIMNYWSHDSINVTDLTVIAERHGLIQEVDTDSVFPRYKKTNLIGDNDVE